MEGDAFSSCYILREDPCLFPLLQRLYKFGRGFFTVIGAVSALMQGMMIGPRMGGCWRARVTLVVFWL